MTMELNGLLFPVEVIRSGRKSIEVRIEENRLSVRAPRAVTNQEIQELLWHKKPLLEKKQQQIAKWQQEHGPSPYEAGRICPFLGRKYQLFVVETGGDGYAEVFTEGECLVCRTPDGSPETVQALVERWYRENARQVIADRVCFYQPAVGRTVNWIAIREQKSRWGSCSAKSNLNFNWHLMEFPLEVVDYVVVHELCHLIHMDHTEAFWAEVERILPDYRERRIMLRR